MSAISVNHKHTAEQGVNSSYPTKPQYQPTMVLYSNIAHIIKHVMTIRSSSQDDTDGTSSIVLPCPGSQIMFHLVPYVNIVLNILLCSPFSTCNNNIYCTIQTHLYFYITTSNVPFSDIFVPKHIFKACYYTIYCLIQSTLYFKKTSYIVP